MSANLPESAPLISILLPAYNHAQYITDTVESIWRLSYPNVEIVLIDDGSRDETFAIAQALQARSPLPMRASRQQNSGLSVTLNRALALAAGEYVAVIASDDAYCGRFEPLVAGFQANPELKVAIANGRHWQPPHIGSYRLVTPETIALLERGDLPTVMTTLYLGNLFISTAACLYRRSFLGQIGGWDATVRLDDWVLVMRLFRAMRSQREYQYFDEDLFLHRLHGANSEGNVDDLLAMVLEAAAAYAPPELLERVRANLYWQAGVRMLRRGKVVQASSYFWQSQRIDFDVARFTDLTRKGVQRFVLDKIKLPARQPQE